MIGAPRLQVATLGFGAGTGGQGHDRQCGELGHRSELARRLQPIHHGHSNVHEDEVRFAGTGQIYGLLSIPRDRHEEIKILGGFVVADDTTTTITLDFDVEQSLVLLGNGGWLLKPVIIKTVAGP